MNSPVKPQLSASGRPVRKERQSVDYDQLHKGLPQNPKDKLALANGLKPVECMSDSELTAELNGNVPGL